MDRYGIRETRDGARFHTERTLWAIVNERIAWTREYATHLDWFDTDGIEAAGRLRGYATSDELRFYRDDFELNDEDEAYVRAHIEDFVETLGLRDEQLVSGGAMRSERQGFWPPIRTLGTVGELRAAKP